VVGLAAGLVAHLAGQLLLFPVVELEPVAWLLAGMVVAGTDAGRPRRRVAPRVVTAALGVVVLAALVAGLTEVRADRRAGDASEALARGDRDAAASAALEAVDQRPDIVRLHVLAAAALVADERGALAGIRELDRALDVSPGDPIVLLARARLLVDRAAATQVPAHLDAASAELHRLLENDPNNGALWRESERLAGSRGDAAGARAAAERADALTRPDRSAR
jgi:predicted Zn-dependent protease